MDDSESVDLDSIDIPALVALRDDYLMMYHQGHIHDQVVYDLRIEVANLWTFILEAAKRGFAEITLSAEGIPYAVELPEVEEGDDAVEGDDYVDVYERSDGRWGWRLVAGNGRIVATDGGQGYENRNTAVAMGRKVVGGHYAGQ